MKPILQNEIEQITLEYELTKKANTKSDIWSNFSLLRNKETGKVCCNHCQIVLGYKRSSTINMKAHFCLNYAAQTRLNVVSVEKGLPIAPKKIFETRVIKGLEKLNLPLSVVDNPSFHEILQAAADISLYIR